MVEIICSGTKEGNNMTWDFPPLGTKEGIVLLAMHNFTSKEVIDLFRTWTKTRICIVGEGSYNVFKRKLTEEELEEWRKENGTLYILPDIF